MLATEVTETVLSCHAFAGVVCRICLKELTQPYLFEFPLELSPGHNGRADCLFKFADQQTFHPYK